MTERKALDNLATAFGLLAPALKLSGTKLTRAQLQSRWRVLRPEISAARTAPMLKRRKRREVVRRELARGKDTEFRPVYFYLGIPVTPHKPAIAALKSMTIGSNGWAGVRDWRRNPVDASA